MLYAKGFRNKEDINMASNVIKLQGHEKFALREGWINKGLEQIPKYDNVFLEKDAPEIFGIGNNMVKSLRYWMRAFNLTNNSGSDLSRLGEIVLENDEFIEDIFTIWILHSQIVKKVNEATSWYMYFNKCDADDLDKNQITSILYREIYKFSEGKKFSEKSLASDVDVLLSMYSRTKEKDDPEDKNISPFAQLGLVKNNSGKYSKSHPSDKSFSEFIVLYEIAEQLEDDAGLSIERLIDGKNGLSKVYNLTSVFANELLDKLDAAGYIRVDRTAGLDMIYQVEQLNPYEVIEDYYRK